MLSIQSIHLTTPVKKIAALALVHMEPHLPSRTDMIFTVSYRRRFGSEMGGRNA